MYKTVSLLPLAHDYIFNLSLSRVIPMGWSEQCYESNCAHGVLVFPPTRRFDVPVRILDVIFLV